MFLPQRTQGNGRGNPAPTNFARKSFSKQDYREKQDYRNDEDKSVFV